MVTGATGNLGVRVVRELSGQLAPHRLVATALRPGRSVGRVPVRSLDLRDGSAVVAAVRSLRPDVIIHLGAVASVHRAEAAPIQALTVNALGTDALAGVADEVGSTVVLASTDFVFDGQDGDYREGDVATPVNAYGRTKQLAELALDGDRHLVVRLPLLFGRGPGTVGTAFDAQVAALRQGAAVVGSDDEFRTPLSLGHAARALAELAARGCTGVIHVAGTERVSRFGLIEAYAAALGVATVLQADAGAAASTVIRPRDVSLRIDRLRAELPELTPPPLGEDVARELGRASADPRPAVVALPRSRPRPGPRVTTSADEPEADAARATRPPAGRSTLTVVVPAHQNAADIGRCLASLAAQAFVARGELSVVVACNGCTDATAAVARRWVPRLHAQGVTVHILDLTSPGRALAFNAADPLAGPGPRVYLDADAALSPGALDDLATALAPGTGVHFAVPRVEVTPPRTLVSRGYARLWGRVPYVAHTGSTMGMYAVSEAGRRRWGAFPAIRSDDKFARLHFARHERAVLPASTYLVGLPDGIRDLYRARVRYERGNRELALAFPGLLEDEPPRYAGLSGVVGRRPDLWPAAASLGVIQTAAVVAARWAPSPAVAAGARATSAGPAA